MSERNAKQNWGWWAATKHSDGKSCEKQAAGFYEKVTFGTFNLWFLFDAPLNLCTFSLPFCVCPLQLKSSIFISHMSNSILRWRQLRQRRKILIHEATLAILKTLHLLSKLAPPLRLCVMCVQPVPSCRCFQMLLLLSPHAGLASLPHPLLEEKKVTKRGVQHILFSHFSHSALSSLSVIFIQCPGGSFFFRHDVPSLFPI